MKNKTTVFITGITGKQGGALARNLIDSDVHIKGLSRSLESLKAKEFEELGVEIVKGDLDKPESFIGELQGVDILFLVQAFEQGPKKEIKQAEKIIDLVCNSGIQHLIYSSVMGAHLQTGIPHFDSKFVIENYIQQKSIDYTILRPASFMENYLNPIVLKKLLKGTLVTPLKKEVVQQLISTEDIGKIASQIIRKLSQYKNKTISIATDEKSISEQLASFSQVLDMPVSYQKLPGILTFLFMGKDLYKMFRYMNLNGFVGVDSIDSIKDEFEGLEDMDQWIATTYKSYME